MKKTITTILLVISLFTFGLAQTKVSNLSPKECLLLLTNKKVKLIDVRTKNEFNKENIEGSVNINLYSSDFKTKILELPKSSKIILYCATGYRSYKAGQFLVQNGYTKVYNMSKGIMGWRNNQFATISGKKSQDKISYATYSKLLKSPRSVFIDFYAPWCPPCRKMLPIVNKLKKEYKNKIDIVTINTEENKNLSKRLNIKGVPYLMLVKNGKTVFTSSKAMTEKEIRKLFSE